MGILRIQDHKISGSAVITSLIFLAGSILYYLPLEIPHKVRPEEKKERSQKILDLSESITHAFYNRYIGKVRPVLLEHSKSKRTMHGFTDNYIRVEINLPEGTSSDMLDNTIVSVRLGEWNEDGTALKGEII